MQITVNHLTKTYGERTVLNIENLCLNSGGFYGIIGANGAGKSTLLNLLAGLDERTSGQILYDEHLTEKIPMKDMTLVFQKAYLLATSVEKNIAYPLKLRNVKKEEMEERVTFLMKELDILHLRKQKSWKLSGGETQKVALARALSFKPMLLLLDEPTANIDPSATAEIENMLRKINEEDKTTIIMITHNLAQGKRICKDIIYLHQGLLVEQGLTLNFFAKPKELLTKKFLEGELLY